MLIDLSDVLSEQSYRQIDKTILLSAEMDWKSFTQKSGDFRFLRRAMFTIVVIQHVKNRQILMITGEQRLVM
ncbi:MAG: hypothetical protein ACLTKE_10970 [Coprococcus sp.]